MSEEIFVVERAVKGNKELRLVIDPEPDNPRETSDNFGHMVAWHRRYDLSDKDTAKEFPTPESFNEFLRENKGKIVMLKIQAYEHSGITIRAFEISHEVNSGDYPFNDRWDAYCIGCIYATYEDIRKEFSVKHVTKKTLEKALNILHDEIKTFDLYLTGQVYGYQIVTKHKCKYGEHEEVTGSCWGFYYFTFEEFKKEMVSELGNNWEKAKWSNS